MDCRTWLAIVALLGMIVLSAWNGAHTHDDGGSRTASIGQLHGGPVGGDADGPIHAVAHSIGHGLAVPSAATLIFALVLHGPGWPDRVWLGLRQLDPGSILRPPRA